MEVVYFPAIQESFSRAINDVLSIYFNDIGGDQVLADQTITYPPADIIYDVRKLSSPARLTLTLLNLPLVNYSEQKVNDLTGHQLYAFELRAKSRVNIAVSTPLDASDPKKSYREVVRGYDALGAIFRTQHLRFAARGIHNPQFAPSPIQIPDLEFAAAVGVLNCEVRCTYHRDANL